MTRRVRTTEGARRYGLPIGSPIAASPKDAARRVVRLTESAKRRTSLKRPDGPRKPKHQDRRPSAPKTPPKPSQGHTGPSTAPKKGPWEDWKPNQSDLAPHLRESLKPGWSSVVQDWSQRFGDGKSPEQALRDAVPEVGKHIDTMKREASERAQATDRARTVRRNRQNMATDKTGDTPTTPKKRPNETTQKLPSKFLVNIGKGDPEVLRLVYSHLQRQEERTGLQEEAMKHIRMVAKDFNVKLPGKVDSRKAENFTAQSMLHRINEAVGDIRNPDGKEKVDVDLGAWDKLIAANPKMTLPEFINQIENRWARTWIQTYFEDMGFRFPTTRKRGEQKMDYAVLFNKYAALTEKKIRLARLRHVRTPEGAELYGQPIGSVIKPDLIPLRMPGMHGMRRFQSQQGPRPEINRPRPNELPTRTVRGGERQRNGIQKGVVIGRKNIPDGVWNDARIQEVIAAATEQEGVRWVRYDPKKHDAKIKASKTPPLPKEGIYNVLVNEAWEPGSKKLVAKFQTKDGEKKDESGVQKFRWQPRYAKAAQAENKNSKFKRLSNSRKSLKKLQSNTGDWDGPPAVGEITETNTVGKEVTRRTNDEAAYSAVVRFMMVSGMRPDSSASNSEKITVGALSLRKRHVQVSGDSVTLNFVPGKAAKDESGQRQSVTIKFKDHNVASVLKHWLEEADPDTLVFRDREGNKALNIDYLRAFVRKWSGDKDLDVKDLRTQVATGITEQAVEHYMRRNGKIPTSKREFLSLRKELAKAAQERLGHTDPSMTINNYINPSTWLMLGIDASWIEKGN